MSREEAIRQLKQAQENGDIESAHSKADYVLCALLAELGYQDVLDEWEKVEKWYA